MKKAVLFIHVQTNSKFLKERKLLFYSYPSQLGTGNLSKHVLIKPVNTGNAEDGFHSQSGYLNKWGLPSVPTTLALAFMLIIVPFVLATFISFIA